LGRGFSPAGAQIDLAAIHLAAQSPYSDELPSVAEDNSGLPEPAPIEPPLQPRLLPADVQAAAFEVERQLDALAAAMEEPQPSSAASVGAKERSGDDQALPWLTERLSGPESLAALRQAQELVARASELGARGAHFAARADFLRALRLVADALDRARGTGQHARALSAGLQAIAESADFTPPPGSTRPLDLQTIVAAHDTPLLRNGEIVTASPTDARQAYCSYAAEQLAVACGREPVASLALYGLGKLQMAMSPSGSVPVESYLPRAAACYQAAVLTDEHNFLATNELAVAHAHCGRLLEARQLLERAAPVADRPELWQNLAAVGRQLGDSLLTRSAEAQAKAVASRSPLSPSALSSVGVPIRIVDARSFSQSSLPFDPIVPAAGAALPAAAPTPQRAAERKASRSWPWSARK
jgi:tetratricopeptide (TPR) repeat protein